MRDWLWNQLNYVPAYFFILVYAVKDEDVLWLFCAVFVVIHAKGNEILEAIKDDDE